MFKALSTRTNVIVMGDSLGDANMAEGVTPGGTILKIGYLSVNVCMLLKLFFIIYVGPFFYFLQ